MTVKTTQWSFPASRALPTISGPYYALALDGSQVVTALTMAFPARLLHVRIKREPGDVDPSHIYEIVVRVNREDVVPNTMKENWLTVGPSNREELEGDLCGLARSALVTGDQLQVFVRGWGAETGRPALEDAKFKPLSVEVIYESLKDVPVWDWNDDPFDLGAVP